MNNYIVYEEDKAEGLFRVKCKWCGKSVQRFCGLNAVKAYATSRLCPTCAKITYGVKDE